MQVSSITLENFKKHEFLHVDFQRGSNLITGPNYSGKSTILQGILVGLYGNSMAPGSANELIRTGASTYEITLKLSNGVVIKRSSKNSSVSRGDEEPYARGHTAVNLAVAELLSLDKNAFTKVFTSEQGSPQQLLAMEGAELQRFVESAISIEQLDEVTKLANREAVSLTSAAGAIADLVLSKEVIAELEGARDHNLRVVETLRNDFATLASVIEAQKSAKAEQALLLEAAQTRNMIVAAYESKLEQMKGLSLETPLDYSDKDAELLDLRSQLNQQVTIKGMTAERAKLVNQNIKSAESLILGIPEPIDVAPLRQEAARLTGLFGEATANLNNLKQAVASSTCPTCRRPYKETTCLEDLLVEIDNAKVVLEDTRILKADANNVLEAAEKANADADKSRRSNARIDADIAHFQSRIDTLDKDLKLLVEADTSDLEARISSLTMAIKRQLVANADIEATNRLLTRLQAELAKLQKPTGPKIDTTPFSISIRGLDTSIQAGIQEMGEIKQAEFAANNLIDKALTTLRRHEESLEKFNHYGNKAKVYKGVATILADNRTLIISEAMSVIFAVASDFAKICTEGDMEEVLLNNGAISYREKGAVYSKYSASGAQKTLMGLGMKLGLVRLVNSNFDSLLLDEISADFSDETSLRCSMALDNFCGQSISVSHRVLDVAGNTIRL